MKPTAPAPIARIPKEFCKRLAWFFTDIDDTLTTDGLIPSGAFDSLWQLHEQGIRVVPVTGRPAGWCDHIARMWPVSAVVGENGAFYFADARKLRKI
jgi:HAD superfamily hydrolase (TIGR01484 family)